MKTKVLSYNTIIKKEGNDYVAYVPTLGISDFGVSIDEAQKNIKNAIQIHLEGLTKTKTDIPEPDSREFFIGQTEVLISSKLKFA